MEEQEKQDPKFTPTGPLAGQQQDDDIGKGFLKHIGNPVKTEAWDYGLGNDIPFPCENPVIWARPKVGKEHGGD